MKNLRAQLYTKQNLAKNNVTKSGRLFKENIDFYSIKSNLHIVEFNYFFTTFHFIYICIA